MQTRLARAEEEMRQIPHYDYHVTNYSLETAFQVMKGILIAEEHKVSRLNELH